LKYLIEFKRTAIKDLEKIDKSNSLKILNKIKQMESDLQGDIKKLTNFTLEYRLRVGNYRVLFEQQGNKIIVYRIKHRKDIYK
jgi:mRNA interferase RelE/StbE